MNAKLLIGACIASAALGAGVTRIYATREVVKMVEVEKIVVQEKIVNHTHTVVEPNGTKIIDSTTSEAIVEHDNKQTTIVDVKPGLPAQWLVNIGMNLDHSYKSFTIDVNRRIIGPIYLGASVTTNGVVGAHVGVEF